MYQLLWKKCLLILCIVPAFSGAVDSPVFFERIDALIKDSSEAYYDVKKTTETVVNEVVKTTQTHIIPFAERRPLLAIAIAIVVVYITAKVRYYLRMII